LASLPLVFPLECNTQTGVMIDEISYTKLASQRMVEMWAQVGI